MLNIMIVDDEVLVRTNIKLMLHQYENDFSICGEASSAEEALELLKDMQPDIVLSDMVMPGMNGVELCKKLRQSYPKIHFVALSNYDDYTLVHDTLKNGGDDYLLKHELSAQKLKDVLASIKPVGEERSEVRELSTFQEKFVLDLITHLITDEEEIKYQMKTLNLRIDSHDIVQILMRVDNYANLIGDNDLQRKRTIGFSIFNIGNEILKTYPTGILTHIDAGYYSILLSFHRENSTAHIQETIRNVISQLSANLKTYLNLTTSYVVGNKSASITNIAENYRQSYQLMKNDLFSAAGAVVYSDDAEKKSATGNVESYLDTSLEKKILESFYIPLEDCETNKEIDSLFTKIKNINMNHSAANNIIMKLLGIFIDVCKTNGIEFSSITPEDSSPFEQLASMTTLEQAHDWFTDYFSKINKLISNSYSGDSEYIRKCLAYIQTNYNEPITLDTAADSIGISKGYLSTLFKDEMGKGFSEYLNNYRIKTAKHLIKSSDIDFHEVAGRTGFQDYSYFFKVFKKMTGMTPAEYKKAV